MEKMMIRWRDRLHPILRWVPISLEFKLRKAAKHVASGKYCLLPSETVYTVVMNGLEEDVVDKMRKIKGRRPNQREGIIAPPEQSFKFIDFDRLAVINPGITPKEVLELYRANPVGLILPCKEGAFPSHLTLDHTENGVTFPTVLVVWNDTYRHWHIFWKEISRHKGTIWVGSSANVTGQPPFKYHKACQVFKPFLTAQIEDPKIENHPFYGSYNIIDLVSKPPRLLRIGNIDPKKHPEEFKKWDNVLDGRLRVSLES